MPPARHIPHPPIAVVSGMGPDRFSAFHPPRRRPPARGLWPCIGAGGGECIVAGGIGRRLPLRDDRRHRLEREALRMTGCTGTFLSIKTKVIKLTCISRHEWIGEEQRSETAG
ncbi:hypothetical protein [Paenirhodobacter sp.]|uniref:hypothetical protein n=1 Tax=Paenirhodobacter sp. TaxID=1965326 RepID=UPI003B3FFC3A